ncbi:MAG TPA: hypothetical protein VGE07_25670 [Herpetosiphonaceae bacterium]
MLAMGARQAHDLADDRLRTLQHQLRHGWRIESPVIERAIFHAASSGGRGYEVILCLRQVRQVLALPDTQAVRDFIAGLDVAVVAI